MLLFSIIDGLGKLIHPNPNAGPSVRFKYFISQIGENYNDKRKEIWDLRNTLIHNGLNSLCFLAATNEGQEEHLKSFGQDNMIYINTRIFYNDFKNKYIGLRQEIMNDNGKIIEYGKRLKLNTSSYGVSESTIDYTTPTPVEFENNK